MKFETTPAFDADYRRIKPNRREAFRRVLKSKFIPGSDAITRTPDMVSVASR
jgi:hypothetical protein